MNEFLEQFLLESRELVTAGTGDLLALEKAPQERARLDGAFRAFHTLKGAAGIMDFAAMARALHAAEEALSDIRAGRSAVTAALIGDCLAALDQVERWLAAAEAAGAFPAAAEAEADLLVRRFGRERTPPAPPAGWLDALLARHPAHRGEARTALRWRPAADSFFRGEDPVAMLAALPGILVLDLAAAAPLPALADLDPFRCLIELRALSRVSPAEAAPALAAIAGVEIAAVPPPPPAAGLAPPARAMLEAQRAVLADASPDGLAGRLGAAAGVARNVLRQSGLPAGAPALDAALAASLAAASPAPLAAALDGILGGPPPDAAPAPVAALEARSLRVEIDRIDTLVRLAGELVVAKNALGYAAGRADAEAGPLAPLLKAQHVALDRLVGQLQAAVLAIRVLPLRVLFQRFPRLVRDLGASLGKAIVLTTAGDDTEADKAVVEALFEPLLHIVRNAADHGLESAAARAARGKPPTGTIHLRATRAGEQIVVAVEDDGAGIDLGRVRQLAAERGLATPAALAAMPDEALYDILFAPGFSTAAAVTDLSGRGVGMDAVRAAVGRLGGRVKVASRAGQGTSVTFTLPFTVMVSRVMTVEAAGQAFGIPLDAVVETALVPAERILPVGAAHAFVLRGRTVPLIDLRTTLGLAAPDAGTGAARVVVVSLAGLLGAVAVDRFGERLDVILKPMDGLLGGAPGLAGTTVLGDGRVLVVLRLEELLA